ncbi:hypothetical protein [Candidatus Parabeggiatoa sp. HSG14]|uniref:hypothetical protein n=1 Tax=Candidatus Parabeggiatoa sp. HSG14 TaxID=3055593 RepID=UPI0025A88A6E|nr:hypothetical protein [Thiotrichales bacterium HSG14]
MVEAKKIQNLFKKLILFVFLLTSHGGEAVIPGNLLEIECDQFETRIECQTRHHQSILRFNKLAFEHNSEVQAGTAYLKKPYDQVEEIFSIQIKWKNWAKRWHFSQQNSIKIKLQDAKKLWYEDEKPEKPVFIYIDIQKNKSMNPKFMLFGLGKDWEFVDGYGYAKQCEEQCGDFKSCEIDYYIAQTQRQCDLAYRQLPSQYRNDYRGKQVIAEILKGMNLTVEKCKKNGKQYFEVEIKRSNECSKRLQQCKKNCNEGSFILIPIGLPKSKKGQGG